jgi:centromeric protein E
VIRSLSELYDKDKRVENFEGKYINFRDSKLTRILQPCLTGNSKTIVICTIQQLEECIGETINTLKFGVAANSIKINASKNVITNPTTKDPRYEELLGTLQQERAIRRKVEDELVRLKSFYE